MNYGNLVHGKWYIYNTKAEGAKRKYDMLKHKKLLLLTNTSFES